MKNELVKGSLDWLAALSVRCPNTVEELSIVMLTALRNSPRLAEFWFSPANRIGTEIRESWNRARAFQLFSKAHRNFDNDQPSDQALINAVVAVIDQDRYAGLWTVEGLGHCYASKVLEISATPISLLSSDTLASGLPNQSLIPLHTGMGLAFATKLVRTLPLRTSLGGMREALDQFLRLCRCNSLPGYDGAAIEALGLATCLLRPRLVSEFDRLLLSGEPELLQHFWHGYGRGLYFAPTSTLPCTSMLWPSINKAMSVPPHQTGRENAVAGLAWAITLVNIRDPQVLESFLDRQGQELSGDAIVNGVNSALAVWHDWAPETVYIQRICDYIPRISRADSRERRRSQSSVHCDGRLRGLHSELKRRNDLKSLFRYQPVSIGHHN